MKIDLNKLQLEYLEDDEALEWFLEEKYPIPTKTSKKKNMENLEL